MRNDPCKNYLIRATFLIYFMVAPLGALWVHPAQAATATAATQRAQASDIEVDLVETGDSDRSFLVREALVFRVRANDRRVGEEDGDGIDFVTMSIFDERGRRVSSRRENNAGYCAFGEGAPDCIVYNFEENNNRWPNGDRIRDGEEYRLRAVVRAEDGRQQTLETTVIIDLSESTDLEVEMLETGRNDQSSEVRDALVFRVRANDPRVGDDDGDGIDFVDMVILNEEGRIVSRKRENTAGYCAFGEGAPDCNVYDFEENNNRWPTGERIRDGGEYRLLAVIHAEDGRRTVFDRTIEVRLD